MPRPVRQGLPGVGHGLSRGRRRLGPQPAPAIYEETDVAGTRLIIDTCLPAGGAAGGLYQLHGRRLDGKQRPPL